MADLTDAQLLILKPELATDSKGLSYAGKNSTAIAAILNTPGLSHETQTGNGVVSTQSLLNCIVPSEYNSLSATLQQHLTFWFSAGSIDTSNANVRAAIGGIFASAPQSLAALQAAVDKPISRAESLFGVGTVVNYWDVDRAKAIP